MLRRCALGQSSTVVEIGPGTGAFTGLILGRIGKQTTFFALELDAMFTRALCLRFPSLTVYNDSAERIGEYLRRHGKASADCVISGLPWASLPKAVQDRVFNSVLVALAPGGVFVTFGYVHARWFPKAQRFRRRLESSYRRVETSRVVWGNFPPAFVYHCTR
jgi:phospholipid N-methyltransferase